MLCELRLTTEAQRARRQHREINPSVPLWLMPTVKAHNFEVTLTTENEPGFNSHDRRSYQSRIVRPPRLRSGRRRAPALRGGGGRRTPRRPPARLPRVLVLLAASARGVGRALPRRRAGHAR